MDHPDIFLGSLGLGRPQPIISWTSLLQVSHWPKWIYLWGLKWKNVGDNWYPFWNATHNYQQDWSGTIAPKHPPPSPYHHHPRRTNDRLVVRLNDIVVVTLPFLESDFELRCGQKCLESDVKNKMSNLSDCTSRNIFLGSVFSSNTLPFFVLNQPWRHTAKNVSSKYTAEKKNIDWVVVTSLVWFVSVVRPWLLQLVEHKTFNLKVQGSSPCSASIMWTIWATKMSSDKFQAVLLI